VASKSFKVSGAYTHKGSPFSFSKTVVAENEEAAKHCVYCLLGSNHKLKRGQITLESVAALKSEETAPKAE